MQTESTDAALVMAIVTTASDREKFLQKALAVSIIRASTQQDPDTKLTVYDRTIPLLSYAPRFAKSTKVRQPIDTPMPRSTSPELFAL